MSARTMTAEEAVSHIQNGDRVLIAHACGEPQALTRALEARIPKLQDVETVHMVGMGESAYCRPSAAGHVRHNSLFVGDRERKAIQEGRGDYTPRHFSRIPALFSDGSMPLDVVLLQVSPPDKHGYMSLGISVDYARMAIKHARKVILQVNSGMPRCHGDCFVHVSEADGLVYVDEPLLELGAPTVTDVERTIARHCADLICDGATLQLGIGSLPDAVLNCLTDKQDLGIHSELISDGVVALVETGVINNRRKTLHPGRTVATFLMGSRRLYDYADDNPAIYMAPVDYVNNPYVIAQNDNMVSINSCVQVDLMGQVCSESVGLTQISAAGGQVDFVRGAQLSKGGVSIIAMPATARGGTLSKVVPFLEQGSAVTTNRNDVMFICTEYGAVNLQGKNLRQRARDLISIAHPDFRGALTEEYERRFHQQWSF